MTKTLLHVLRDVLQSARRRAATTKNEGEPLWLHTYVVEPLADVLEAVEPGRSRFVWNAKDVKARVSKRSKK